MTKGTPSFGRRSGKKTHIPCRRCGYRSYHVRKKRCAQCGYPDARMRKYRWTNKLLLHKARKPQRSPGMRRKALVKNH